MIPAYLKYLFKSHNLHGVHSPFVYDLNENVLNRRVPISELKKADSYRDFLGKQTQKIHIEEMGSGSRVFKNNIRVIKEIYSTTGTNKRLGEILYQLIKHYDLKNILEIGTGLGVGTTYIYLAASQLDHTTIHTIEGSSELFNFTKSNFRNYFPGHNIAFHEGNFDKTLPELLLQIPSPDLVFMDGNHTYEATLRYFIQLLPKMQKTGVIIIDDINWNSEMQKAWIEIQQFAEVTISIDLFRWGVVFFRKEIQKEHFIIRFNDFLKAHIL